MRSLRMSSPPERAAPLYGRAERFELGPLPASVAAEYVAEQFASTGRAAGPALRPLVQAAAGHPQRLSHWAVMSPASVTQVSPIRWSPPTAQSPPEPSTTLSMSRPCDRGVVGVA